MAAPKTKTTVSARRETPDGGAAVEVTAQHAQPTTAAARAITPATKKQKFLKSTRNGVVYLFTDGLATRDDMVLCDAAGHPTFADDELPFEAMPLKDQIANLQTREQLIDFADNHGLSFEKDTPPRDMRVLLLKELCPGPGKVLKTKPETPATAAASAVPETPAGEPEAEASAVPETPAGEPEAEADDADADAEG